MRHIINSEKKYKIIVRIPIYRQFLQCIAILQMEKMYFKREGGLNFNEDEKNDYYLNQNER